MSQINYKARIGKILEHLESGSSLITNNCSTETELIQNERENPIFSPQKMEEFMFGKEICELRHSIAEEIKNDKLLNDGYARYDETLEESRFNTMKKMIRISNMLKGKSDVYKEVLLGLIDCYDRSTGMKLFVQFPLFGGTLANQSSEEQIEKWLPHIENLKMIGCFGMTELGHSSHLRGIETIARFSQKDDSFIINSETKTATKVWIGLSSQTATHCIVFANLFIEDKECGIQLFLVPLRDPETGFLLPGVKIGDMGHKAGRNGLDNGWLRFENVVIPRFNMLAKWAQVERNGDFNAPPNAALAYGGTVLERVSSVAGSSNILQQCVTISTRYGVARTQGPRDPQLLDFQGHQFRILPLIASAFISAVTAERVTGIYKGIMRNLQNGEIQEFMTYLPDLHSLSCGLKAFWTWHTASGLELTRRTLGGHGFASLSGLPALIADFGVMTTGGGDNIVIAQQTASFLSKIVKNIQNGNTNNMGHSIGYFQKFEKLLSRKKAFPEGSLEQYKDLSNILFAFQRTTIQIILNCNENVDYLMKNENLPYHEAKNQTMNDFVECSLFHSICFSLESFLLKIESAPKDLKPILEKLFVLFGLNLIDSKIGFFLQNEFIDSNQIREIRNVVKELCLELRNYAVILTDSFGLEDFLLMTPLGQKDGDIYNHYLDALEKNRESQKILEKNQIETSLFWRDLVKPLVTQ